MSNKKLDFGMTLLGLAVLAVFVLSIMQYGHSLKLAEKKVDSIAEIEVPAVPFVTTNRLNGVVSAEEWSQYYADIQRTVLPSAVKMLKPGGMMIYSTCTFSKLEDEDSISFILENNPDMELIESHKLFPHKIKGEGHFVALLHKKDTATALAVESSAKDGKEKGTINKYDTKVRSKYKKISDEAFDFFESIGFKIDVSRLWVNEDRINMLPEDAPDLSRLRVLRTGLFLGEMKKGRFEPSQSLALALKAEEYPNILDLKLDDDRVVRYLKCESIDVEDGEVNDGYCLVAVDGYPLGWGKVDKGRFKNKYLPSWRLQ